MTPEPQSVIPMLAVERVKQLLVLSALAMMVAACGLPAGRDARAYNACLVRHPGETVLCEGPRQAYEIDGSTLQLGAASVNPLPADSH